MKRYALALLCLAVGSAFAVVPTTIYIDVGNNLYVGQSADHYNEVVSCIITDNKGTQFTLYPDGDKTNTKFQLTIYDKCKTGIYHMTKADIGEWRLTTIVNKTNRVESTEQAYNVVVRKIFEEKTLTPASRAWVYPNQQVSVSFKETFGNNLERCLLLSPEKHEYDLKSGKLADIKLLGECGFKMNVKDEYAGKWTLIADLKNDTAFYADFDVHINNLNELKPNQTTVVLKRGDSATLQAGKQQNTQLCIMEDPHGVRYPIVTGYCSHNIDIVTERHEGIWTAYYGVRGMEKLVEQKILVQTYEISRMNHSITYENGNINLLCRVQTHEMKYCTFIRPDGEMLYMTLAVGNEKYRYYGNGFNQETNNEFDCGLTIQNPSSVDYGSWRCVIGLNSNTPVGRILKVSPNSRSTTTKSTSAKDIYTKLGDSFTVRCSTDEVLSYCWLRSPDGKSHSVIPSERDVKAPALKYEGRGLELGDCGAQIKVSNETDAGKWTCHMGVANGPEVEASFKVVIKDTHLMASKNLINAESTTDTTLMCQPLPDSDKVIKTCRWVNPLGHGINVMREGRYITETSTTYCKLTIRGINSADDIGQWSCFARFIDNHEGNDNILITSPSSGISTFLVTTVIISLLLCAGVGIFAIMRIRPWGRSATPDDKIFLQEKPPKYP